MVNRNSFIGGVLPDRHCIHGTETGREKEEQSCESYEYLIYCKQFRYSPNSKWLKASRVLFLGSVRGEETRNID